MYQYWAARVGCGDDKANRYRRSEHTLLLLSGDANNGHGVSGKRKGDAKKATGRRAGGFAVVEIMQVQRR
jgi:hypothetical protein